jgi:ribonuclease HII
MHDYDFSRLENGAYAHIIAGVDEVGRGALVGPVVAAAVLLKAEADVTDIRDSKLIPPPERERLAERIIAQNHVGLALIPASIIDAINIRQATLLAMRRALEALPLIPDLALIDGRDIPPHLPYPARALIGGDRLSKSIAAASIVAKVTRDALMAQLPDSGYGFAQHKGYATLQHRNALAQLGLSPWHRRTFYKTFIEL